jgi:hypothetical protein
MTTTDTRHELDVLNEALQAVPKEDRDALWDAMWKRDQAIGREIDRQSAPYVEEFKAAGYNDKQVKTAMGALRECLKADGHGHAHHYEFKMVDASVFCGGTAWLAVRTGYRNDEGTAAILFQKTRYFTIGRQGGITLTNGKGKRSRPVKGLRNIACTELKY